jgi:hypothetical protein
MKNDSNSTLATMTLVKSTEQGRAALVASIKRRQEKDAAAHSVQATVSKNVERVAARLV